MLRRTSFFQPMEFKVKVLENRKSIGLRSIGADNLEQAESGLLQLLQEYMGAGPSDVRWLYEVKADALRRIMFYVKGRKGKEARLRVQIKQVV